MPKQKGYFKFSGTLQGKCYYQLNGKYVVRKAVGPSRERINNDPAFVNVKSNNQEFSAASKLSKAIRHGLGNNANTFKDSYMAGRLTGCCRKIIQKGSGHLGQREANLHNNPNELVGFQLNKTLVFNQLFTSKPIITTNNTRTITTVSIPKSTNNSKRIPNEVTHFQLTAALSWVSNLQWQSHINSYSPAHPEQNALGITKQTQPLICKIEHQSLNIPLHIPNTQSIPADVAITVWLGIRYLQINNNKILPYQSAKAMECIAVL